MNCLKPNQESLSSYSDDLNETITNFKPSLKINLKNLVEVPSPSQIGKIKPKNSGRRESKTFPKLPSKKIVNIFFLLHITGLQKNKTFFFVFPQLNLKTPKSGIFINESINTFETSLPYPGYNPRKLQEKLDNQHEKYVVINQSEKLYAVSDKNFHLFETKSKLSDSAKSLLDEKNGLVIFIYAGFNSKAKTLIFIKGKCCAEKGLKKIKKEIKIKVPVNLNLGFPVGMLFGSLNIWNDYFSEM